MFEHYEDILTVDEVTEALRIGKNRVYALLNRGELCGYKEGRHWRVSKTALEDYVVRKSRGE